MICSCMELTILTPEDLRQFKQEILDEIKAGFERLEG